MLQGTAEWKAAKLGKLGASKVHEALARTKTGWGASRANCKAAIVAERLTGVFQDGYTNAAMAWGVENEPLARAAYEFHTDCDVDLVGWIDHPRIRFAGASPDGRVKADGLVEIKCPGTATHIETLLGAPIDDKYVKQMQWQMATEGRSWCDFASFDPRLPPAMQLHVRRVKRDDQMIAELEREVAVFLDEVAETVAKLQRLYQPAKEAAA